MPDPTLLYDVAYFGFNQVPNVHAMCKMLVKHWKGPEAFRIETDVGIIRGEIERQNGEIGEFARNVEGGLEGAEA
jgi:hypothetical protein